MTTKPGATWQTRMAKMTDVQVCPECGQLFEYGPVLGNTELCSFDCRAERALADAARAQAWELDELGLRGIEAMKRGKP
jgi:hypothetical protein